MKIYQTPFLTRTEIEESVLSYKYKEERGKNYRVVGLRLNGIESSIKISDVVSKDE